MNLSLLSPETVVTFKKHLKTYLFRQTLLICILCFINDFYFFNTIHFTSVKYFVTTEVYLLTKYNKNLTFKCFMSTAIAII